MRPAFLDEALAVREWRRLRRWLLTSSLPVWLVLGSLALPWLVVPALYSSLGSWSGQTLLQSQPRWMFLTLALTLVGGAAAAAFARVSQLWHTERVRQTLEGWFLAGLEPRPLVITAALSGAALALLVALPGALFLVGTAFFLKVTAIRTLLTLALLLVSPLLAAAAATAAFLATVVAQTRPERSTEQPDDEAPLSSGHPVIRSSPHHPITPSSQQALAIAAVLAVILALWLRIEAVEHGWSRPWEEHPARLMLAAGLLTPAPVLMGFANPRWWVFRVVERLDFPITSDQAALILLLLYAAGTLLLLRWSERAYRLFSAEPERDRLAPAGSPDEGELVETATRGYWAGFANPVWTRELRTRLRGREAPQFIFFASVALAVGGFSPLVSAAGQLGDPLATAAVAREVFFWLAMTLTALVALVAPGLTAEGIGMERARGSLELLLATPLQRAEILRGKLLGDLCVLALLVSPSLPLFGFCYLFHGASGPQVVGVFVVLAITALLCSVLGITASAIHTRTMPAKWQAYLLSLLFCCFLGGPFWLMGILAAPGGPAASGGAPIGPFGLTLLSPMFMVFYGIVLAGMWNRACERLDYVED